MNTLNTKVWSLTLATLLVFDASYADLDKSQGNTDAEVVDVSQTSLSLAKKAAETAAEEAADAVITDTKLDLDIRLIGPTSVTIAGER